MIKLKNAEEIELLRENALLVSRTLAEVGKHIKPGVTTLELDKIAETFIRDHGAEPAFLGYGGFPFTLCLSVNETVVHGFASDYRLKEGDIISVDCGTKMKGYYGDSAYTFPVGEISEENATLLRVTKESLFKGIEKAIVGNFIFEIKSIATVTDFEPTNEQEVAVDEVQKAICTVSKKEIKGNDLLTFRRARDGVPARSSWHIN